MSRLRLWLLQLSLWMERRRRDVLLSDQCSFQFRAHEAAEGLKDADANIRVLRRKLDQVQRGVPVSGR